MSTVDRDKWNARYCAGAYGGRTHAAMLVTEYLPEILATQRAGVGGTLRALDLACGAGRNARYLAELGYRVDAVDISSAALGRARADAGPENGGIDWIEYDLDLGLPRGLKDYDIVLLIRYFDLSLVAAAAERLRPGGHIICETHLATDEVVAGPRDPAFRARPGELRQAAGSLEVVWYWEGVGRDPDARDVALARLVAWRPLAKP